MLLLNYLSNPWKQMRREKFRFKLVIANGQRSICPFREHCFKISSFFLCILPSLSHFFISISNNQNICCMKVETKSYDFNSSYSSWSEVLCELICFILVREWPNPVLLKQPEESNLNLPVWDPRVRDLL